MGQKRFFICFAFAVAVFSFSSFGKKLLILTEQDVLKATLSNSLFVKKIQFEKQKNLSHLKEKKHSFSTWNFLSSWTGSQKNNPQVSVFEARRDKTNSWNLSLKKNIPYGLSLKSSYSDLSELRLNSDFLNTAQSPSQIYRKSLSLELNASLKEALTQNWALKAIQSGEEAVQWLYYEKAEELALRSVRQYWKTYLAQVSWLKSQEGLKTYQQLVRQIANKQKYNFLNPGEGPQVLAEYENLQQKADSQKQNYEREKKALFLFLQKPAEDYDLKFKTLPSPPPTFSKIKIDSVRGVQMRAQQITERELKWRSHRVQLFPDIRFISQGGLIPASAGSRKDLSFSRKNSFYELGVSLNWNLFSKSFYEKAHQERYQLEEDKIDMEIFKKEIENQMDSLKEEISVSYKNIYRAERANSYQKKAFKELKRSFDQGRVDIFELIRAENKLRESELRKASALSEYSLLNLQFLALKDQLVEAYL